LSEVQMLHDLDLDLPSGQGDINIDSMSRTTCTPKHVTVASRSSEIWPFEFSKILTFAEVSTVVIALLEGNSKIGLRQAVVHVPYYHHQPLLLCSKIRLYCYTLWYICSNVVLQILPHIKHVPYYLWN